MFKHIGVIADLRTPVARRANAPNPAQFDTSSWVWASPENNTLGKTTATPPITRPATTGFVMTANGAFPARCDKRENNAPDPSNTRARAYPSAMQGTNQTGSSAPHSRLGKTGQSARAPEKRGKRQNPSQRPERRAEIQHGFRRTPQLVLVRIGLFVRHAFHTGHNARQWNAE